MRILEYTAMGTDRSKLISYGRIVHISFRKGSSNLAIVFFIVCVRPLSIFQFVCFGFTFARESVDLTVANSPLYSIVSLPELFP